jgi:gamma-glutamyltranspeptidase / glutathione hydrolase
MESRRRTASVEAAIDLRSTLRISQRRFAWCGVLVLVTAGSARAQVQSCNVPSGTPRPAFCGAVPGDRSEGWLRQGRSETMSQHGMVTTSQSLAAQAGLRILMKGGNAIDAAVATAATLNLMEPMNVGIAGDLFAIIYIAKEKKLYALNASGKAPTGATLQHYNDLGYHWDGQDWGFGANMPGGILSVTVPGAAWGWDEVMRRFGRLKLKDVMEPAIEYAENGFPVTERISNDWNLPRALGPDASNYARGCCTQVDPDSVATWYINGVKPAPGQIYRNPDLAKTLRMFAEHGRKAFYTGEVARAIVAKSTAVGGTMTMEDLATYSGVWAEPIHDTYHGYDIYELPPPAQSWNAVEILDILETCVPGWTGGKSLATLFTTDPVKYWHLLVEAKKLGYNDLYRYNADPDFASNAGLLPFIRNLATKSHASSLCGLVDPNKAGCPTGNGYGACPAKAAAANGEGDTIVLSAADRWGNMVSWVNSNFGTFGSGITVPGYGFILHNRGQQFTMNPNHADKIEPHKRPYNTLSAGFVMKDGRPVMTIGLMGGDMQPQGHAQTLVHILDLGANVQAATDMARFHHSEVPNTLQLESQLFNQVGAALTAMGHNASTTNGGAVGGYQAIMFTPNDGVSAPKCGDGDEDRDDRNCTVNGFYRAGSDHRKDGEAVGW